MYGSGAAHKQDETLWACTECLRWPGLGRVGEARVWTGVHDPRTPRCRSPTAVGMRARWREHKDSVVWGHERSWSVKLTWAEVQTDGGELYQVVPPSKIESFAAAPPRTSGTTAGQQASHPRNDRVKTG